MGQFRDYLREARESSVPTEFRVVLSELKKTYNQGEVPSEKELEIVAEKFMLDAEKFIEFAKPKFEVNENQLQNILSEAKKVYDKNASPEEKANAIMRRCKKFRTDSVVGYLLDDADIIQGITDATKWSFKDSEKYFEDNYKSIKMNEAKELNVGDIVILDVNSIENSEYVNQFPGKKVPKSVKIISPKINVNGDFTFEVPKYRGKEAILPKKFIMESAVGAPGRTTEKDAEEHINDELIAEFKKIIKKLGGKTVAKVLLDKLGQKSEIKDEIEHIEDIIDNSNY